MCNMARYKDNKTLTFYLLKNGLMKSWKTKLQHYTIGKKLLEGWTLLRIV